MQALVNFNYDTFVSDASNGLKGKMTYHIILSGVGADNSYYKEVVDTGLKVDTLF